MKRDLDQFDYAKRAQFWADVSLFFAGVAVGSALAGIVTRLFG